MKSNNSAKRKIVGVNEDHLKRIVSGEAFENMDKEDMVFKKEVPKVYNYTCCITGLKITSNHNISMIDACHIIPFSQTHDDSIQNGLPLCPNLHREFDRGLITIDEDYKVIVSQCFKEDFETSHSLLQFENKKIHLPKDLSFFPGKENLIWHNQEIFKAL